MQGRQDESRPILSEAREAARRALDRESESAYDRYYLAQIAAIEGRMEEGFRWLEDAVASGWVNYRWSLRDPLLANLHAEPRFQTMMAELEAKVSLQRSQVPAVDSP